MGFVVLTKGAVTRRIPYYFEVTQPGARERPGDRAEGAAARATRVTGQNRVSQYRFPSWPFGPPPTYSGAARERARRGEALHDPALASRSSTSASRSCSQSANSEIDPWVLGSKDENDVQGYAGMPVNVNGLMYDYRADIEAAGASSRSTKRYYVSVDSGSDRVHRTSRCPASTCSRPGSTTSRRRR